MRIPSGSTDRYIYFLATLAGAPQTGLTTFTVYWSKNGGAATQDTTPTINETDSTNMPGVYEYQIAESSSSTLTAGNDTEETVFYITQASMDPVTRVVEIYRPETTEGNTLDVTSGGNAGIDFSNINGTLGAANIAANAIGASQLATDAVNEIVDAVWDEAQADHVAAGSMGIIASEIADILVDTAEIGAAGAGLTEAGGTGDQLTAIGGFGANTITAAALATDAVNEIVDQVWDETQASHVTAGSFGEIATEIASILTDTADMQPKLGTPAGASISADIATVDTVVDAIKAKTDSLTFTVAGNVDANTQYINDAQVVGDGNATPWDGV